MVKWLKKRVLVAYSRTVYNYQMDLYVMFRHEACESVKNGGSEWNTETLLKHSRNAAATANKIADWIGNTGRQAPTIIDKALARLAPLFFTWA